MRKLGRDRLGHAEDQLFVDPCLAQLGKLVRRKVEVVDHKLTAVHIAAQILHQPVMDQTRAKVMELAAKARKTLSAHAEKTIRAGLVAALHGRGKRG